MGDVEKIYQKKTQKEHILLRPDSYVGAIERDHKAFWLLNKDNSGFERREISYVPGLYKIFDEILVNAADNVQRTLSMSAAQLKDNPVTFIKVEIDAAKGYVSVSNDGPGIPVETHKEHNCSVPELIFGHLLTGSNFDDSQRKVTGGRNGFGAKLANLFSKKFCVDIGDSKRGKRAKLIWRNNMEKESEEILDYSGKDYVRIMFWPDFARFGMKGFEEDTVKLFQKRVWDLAGIIEKKISVFYNSTKVPIKDFKSYCSLYLGEETKLVYHKEDRWEIGVAISDGEFSQVSFVNSISTTRGGPHVEQVISGLYNGVSEELQKKLKKTPLKPSLVRPHLFVFANCLIENPSFDSQTKEALTTKSTQFGSKVTISDKFCKDVLKAGLTDAVVQQAQVKEQLQLQKTLKGTKATRLLGITKLEDANRAGTSDAQKCTLIVTEGDSAKALAMAGLEVIGRDYYGVYPLRGKFLNVREAAVATLLKNQEVAQLIEILGLSVGKSYGGKTGNLRYGSLMVMADQDHDGSHIKGLVINFIHHFWPDLLRGNQFLREFITPIVKASKGTQVVPFFTMTDYKKWQEGIGHPQSYRIKYYKGLGTSTDKEAREYFSNLREHIIRFTYKDKNDDEAVDLAFNKKKADERKEWLAGFDPNVNVDHSIKQLTYQDFVHKELIQFSVANNQRMIPSLCDGLKTGQRKILFSCFKKRLNGEIKVAQLSGYVAEHSEYHHGEQNLADTIVGMAQSFVGKNNLNLLLPIGQFGSRAVGGKDAASARYIHTALSKIARALFPEPDDHVLTYIEEDGHRVEPVYYLPVVPLALANGSEGIGSGWSTFVPNYSPRELIANIRRKLKGGAFKRMIPWYKGFLGEIAPHGEKGFQVKGVYKTQGRTLDILELPLQKWTRDYKAFLEGIMASPDPVIKIDDIREFHTTRKVHFRIDYKGVLPEGEELEKALKLQGSISCANMVLFDTQSRIKRYNNEVEILDEYFKARLALYSKRKAFLLGRLNRDKTELSNQVEFIRQVSEGKLKLHGCGKKELSKLLLDRGFVPKSKFPKVQSELEAEVIEEPVEEREKSAEKKGGIKPIQPEVKTPSELNDFNYLLSMPIYSLTSDRRQHLEKQLARVNDEIKELQSSTPEDLWNTDLEYLLEVMEELDQEESKEAAAQDKQIKKPSGFVDPEPSPRDKATMEALISKLPDSFRGGAGEDTSDGGDGERARPKVSRISGKKAVVGKSTGKGKSASKDKKGPEDMPRGSSSGKVLPGSAVAKPGVSSSSQLSQMMNTRAAPAPQAANRPSSTFDMSRFVSTKPASTPTAPVQQQPKPQTATSSRAQQEMAIVLSDEEENEDDDGDEEEFEFDDEDEEEDA